MSDKSLEVQDETTKAVVAHGAYGKFAGAGFDNQTAADVAIPIFAILENTKRKDDPRKESPKRGDVGDIFNTLTRELYPAEEGLVAVPCVTAQLFVEWTPKNDDGSGGGGPHNFYLPSDPIVVEARAKAASFNDVRLPNGNQLVETFETYYLLLDSDQDDASVIGFFMIGFTSAKIKAYKAINTRLQSFMLKDDNGEKFKPAMFCHRVRIKGTEVDAEPPYANYVIEPLNGDVASSLVPEDRGDILEQGNDLYQMVMSGAARNLIKYETSASPADGDTAGEAVPVTEGDEPF